MRGEETEAMGMLDSCGGAGLVCLPGTHSKWIQLRDQKIVSFITCMTREVFAVLRKCTILARIMTSGVEVDMNRFFVELPGPKTMAACFTISSVSGPWR